jgi:hypothetical protein
MQTYIPADSARWIISLPNDVTFPSKNQLDSFICLKVRNCKTDRLDIEHLLLLQCKACSLSNNLQVIQGDDTIIKFRILSLSAVS